MWKLELGKDFRQGYMEDLRALGIDDDSIDVVMSNCVLNLSLDKRAVFGEIFRVLKPGGELFFSDIFSDRRVPERFHSDPILHGECLAGAMYTEDFRRLLRDLGCLDYRVTSSRQHRAGQSRGRKDNWHGGLPLHDHTCLQASRSRRYPGRLWPGSPLPRHDPGLASLLRPGWSPSLLERQTHVGVRKYCQHASRNSLSSPLYRSRGSLDPLRPLLR